MVCCIYFKIQKQFDITILAFECELGYLVTDLATFIKVGRFFSQSSGHSAHESHSLYILLKLEAVK